MGLDMTSFDGALKNHYTHDRVENMVYADNPFLALVPKMEDFGGRNLPIPIIYGNPQGRSRSFAKAQARSLVSNSKVTDFVLTRAKDYGIAVIDNETLEASKGDANAFMEATTTEIDGIINSLTRSLSINLFRGSDVSLGQVAATPANSATTFQIQLNSIQDVTNFEIGQNLVSWSAKSGGTQRTSDGTVNTWPVVAVARDTGILTLTGTYNGSGTLAALDYLFVDGDRGIGLSGLEDWLPATTPTNTLFYGVDRSVDPTRLAGWRLDGTNAPIEETLIEADALVSREGWGIDHYFMNPKTIGNLKKSLGTKVQYVDMQSTAKISFRGVLVDGEKNVIKCVGDQNVPANRIFGVKFDFIKLYSLGKAVRVLDTDGLSMLRQGTADGVEVRYGYYANLGIRGPGACINIQV